MGAAMEQEEHPHADHAAGVTAVPTSENAPPSLGASDASHENSPRDPLQPSASDKQPPAGETFIPPPTHHCMQYLKRDLLVMHM